MPQALEDVEHELREIHADALTIATRAADAIAALEALRAVRNGGHDTQAPAPPPEHPPRHGSAAGDPPASAAEPTAAAAPAPRDSTPAAASPAGRDPRRERSLDRVRAAFRRLGPGWHGSGSIGGEAGCAPMTTARCIRDLVADGELDHNGKGGAHSRYRLRGLEHPPEPPPLRPAAAATRRADRERELGKPAATTISRRVQRELDREATTFVDRDDGVGTFPGRILEALQAGPAGVRTLARRLGHERPTPELVTELAHMLATGDLVRHRNADRDLGAETHLYQPAR